MPGHDDDTEEDEFVGKDLLGKLRVKRRIAGGGMGAIYEVEHLLTGHTRALKVLHRSYVKMSKFEERLLREARVAGTLNSPYVVETYDAGFLEDGSAYVLMELLDGQPLLSLLKEQGRLGISRMVGLVCQLCEGMRAAHDAGIIHRDLKPENIFVVRDEEGEERVKILDFGIAKFTASLGDEPSRLTADGTILGTPFYMSSEQAGGREVDMRTDVYSTGVMLYEGTTGILPYDGPSVGAVFAAIRIGEHIPLKDHLPDADPALSAIVTKAMHVSQEQRYGTMEELRQVLLPYAPSGTVKRQKTIEDAAPARATQEYGASMRRPSRRAAETMATVKPSSRPPPRAKVPMEIEDSWGEPVSTVPPAGATSGSTPPLPGDEPETQPAINVASVLPTAPAADDIQIENVEPSIVGGRRAVVVVGLALVIGLVAGVSWAVSGSTDTGTAAAATNDVLPAVDDVEPEREPGELIVEVGEPIQEEPEVEEAPADPTATTMTSMRNPQVRPGMQMVSRPTMMGGTLADQHGLDDNPY